MYMKMSEPTAEQIKTNAQVYEDAVSIGFAAWYPQMGGYSGKAIVIFDKQHKGDDACFDVYVWHDGEFPFHAESGRQPVLLHHCMVSQFADFAACVSALMHETSTK